jgi:hypothetical protein
MEIYTATTATMQKYAGLTEDQVNTQSYSLVLEHLERLSKENEEMEKMRPNSTPVNRFIFGMETVKTKVNIMMPKGSTELKIF